VAANFLVRQAASVISCAEIACHPLSRTGHVRLGYDESGLIGRKIMPVSIVGGEYYPYTTLSPDASEAIFSGAGEALTLSADKPDVILVQPIAAMVAGTVGANAQLTAAAAKQGNKIYIARQNYQWSRQPIRDAVVGELIKPGFGYDVANTVDVIFVRSPTNAPNMHAEMVIARHLQGVLKNVAVVSSPLAPCPVCARFIIGAGGLIASVGKPPNNYWLHPTREFAIQKH
jgi:hypothetical protein